MNRRKSGTKLGQKWDKCGTEPGHTARSSCRLNLSREALEAVKKCAVVHKKHLL